MSYDYSSSSKAGKGSCSSSYSNDWSMCYGSSKSSKGYSMSYDCSSSSEAGKGSRSSSDSNEPTMTYSPTSSSSKSSKSSYVPTSYSSKGSRSMSYGDLSDSPTCYSSKGSKSYEPTVSNLLSSPYTSKSLKSYEPTMNYSPTSSSSKSSKSSYVPTSYSSKGSRFMSYGDLSDSPTSYSSKGSISYEPTVSNLLSPSTSKSSKSYEPTQYPSLSYTPSISECPTQIVCYSVSPTVSYGHLHENGSSKSTKGYSMSYDYSSSSKAKKIRSIYVPMFFSPTTSSRPSRIICFAQSLNPPSLSPISLEPYIDPFSEPSPSPSKPVSTTTTSTVISLTTSPVSEFINSNCCMDIGFRNADDYHRQIPTIDLTDWASGKLTIDGMIDRYGDGIGDNHLTPGWVLDEYSCFLELPMFNGGMNGGDDRIATSYLAYDCASNTACVAAHLDAEYLAVNPAVQVEQDDDESWIRFGETNGSRKLKESNADEFQYAGKPDDPSFVIGFEGCWSVDSIRNMKSVINNYVEVPFSNDGDTTSTGKPASNGDFICLTPTCDPPIISISPTYLLSESPTAQPSVSPSASPSGVPSESPSSIPSSLPSIHSASPSVSSSLSVDPTANPSSYPSSSPSSFPSESPSASPSGRPSVQPSAPPSSTPSLQPSSIPSEQPSTAPSSAPSEKPSMTPSESPSGSPGYSPSHRPSAAPSAMPSQLPSAQPSSSPSVQPSLAPSGSPTVFILKSVGTHISQNFMATYSRAILHYPQVATYSTKWPHIQL
eukprot:scaffold120055_cov77-Cyclotella_meneghiniana.AAC.1